MILTELKKILETLNIAGINQVILDKKDDHILIRGVDIENPEDDISISVFSKAKYDIIDNTMCISNVSTFLNRMNLFDIEEANVKLLEASKYTKSCIIKQKRKKVSYIFSDPRTIRAPKKIVDDEINKTITFTKNDVDNIIKANRAMTSPYLTLRGDGSDIILELNDEVSGKYENVVGDNVSGEWSNHWKTNSIMRMLKYAVKKDDDISLSIGERGIIYIDIDEISFIILPQVK